MRKICAKSLALLLTVAFCFAAFGAAALAANATATSNLNKRSSPSTSASVITVLKMGASLTVVDGIADGETYDGKKVRNGGTLTLADTKDLVVTVTNGLGKQTYTVKITKTGA